jgi:hypothetical protein
MSKTVKYVGLDVHKNTIAVAVAEDGKRGEVREHWEIANTPAALTKLLGKLGGPGSSSTFATRPDHAGTAFSVRWPPLATAALWLPHR